MCLQRVYKGKKKAKVLASFPDMVTCWKIVTRQGNQHNSKFAPEMYRNSNTSLFLAGWNWVKPFMSYYSGYRIAFHAFRTKAGAKRWKGEYQNYLHIVKCKTRKKDIIAIGEQRDNLCIVTQRIWIPKPKKKPA